MFNNRSSNLLRAFIICFISLGLISCDGFGVDEQETITKAREYMAEKKVNAAIIELKNLLQSNATNGEARYLLSQLSLSLGDIKTAEKEVRRALDAGWDEARCQRLHAEILLRLAENDKVKEIAIRDQYPADIRADLTGLWAAADLAQGKTDEARETLTLGDAINADANWILQSKIRLQMLDGDFDAANQLADRAVGLYPENQDFWLLKAALGEQAKDVTAVTAALEKVLSLEPPKIMTIRGRQAAIGLIQNYIARNDREKAEAILAKVLRNYSADPAANYFGALLDYANKDIDAAMEHLSKVLRVVPDHRDSLLLMGNIYYAKKDFTQAAYYLEKATSSTPDNLNAQALLGKTYIALGQYRDAQERLNIVSSRVKNNPQITALIGISQLQDGDTASGIAELEKALVQNPENPGIRQELARAYILSGDSGQAIEKLESGLATDEDKEQYRSKAILLLAHLQAGNNKKALVMAKELESSLPDTALPVNLAGAAHEAMHEYDKARANYERASGLDAEDMLSLLNLGRLDIVEGKMDAAYSHFQKVLDAYPENSAALVGRARVEMSRKQTEAAIKTLEKARNINDRDIESRILLANYFISVGESKRALEYIDEAFRINSKDVRVLAVRAATYVDSRHKQAAQAVADLLGADSELPYAHYYDAKLKLGNKDTAGAKAALQKALQLNPDYLEALVAMGNMERIEGKFDAALTISKELQKRHPDKTNGFLMEADIYLIKKQNAKAIEVLKHALSIATEGDVAIKLNKIYQSTGDSDKGYQVLQGWIDAHPEDLPTRFNLAVSYMAVSNYDMAIKNYEGILKIRPNIPAVMNDLAWLYNETGKPGGLEMARRAHKLVPENPAIQDTYGWMLIQTGRMANGVAVLEDAASKTTQNRDIQYHYAYALNENGQPNKAKAILDKILADSSPFTEREEAEKLLQKLN